jgi:hypothetical protein
VRERIKTSIDDSRGHIPDISGSQQCDVLLNQAKTTVLQNLPAFDCKRTKLHQTIQYIKITIKAKMKKTFCLRLGNP